MKIVTRQEARVAQAISAILLASPVSAATWPIVMYQAAALPVFAYALTHGLEQTLRKTERVPMRGEKLILEDQKRVPTHGL